MKIINYKQIPNLLTISRLVFSPLVIVFLVISNLHSGIFLLSALILFLVGCFTDFLDGYLSRKWNAQTSFGKTFDPMADKILVFGNMIVFMCFGTLEIVIGVLLITRDVIMDVMRFYLYKKKNIVIPASKVAKIKTVSNMLSIVFVLVLLMFSIEGFWLFQVPFCLTLFFSLYSFNGYIRGIWTTLRQQ